MKRQNIKGSIRRTEEGVCVEYGDKQKIFKRKPIFLPNEYDRAIGAHILGTNVIVLGMNGYSSLSEEKCVAYGIKPGDYEIACASLMQNTIKNLQQQYEGITIRIAHGASNMGVDKAMINVGLKLNIQQLGFNCPNYMMYVEDDDIPVYVAKNEREYCEAFTEALDILITANGRKVTFEMDIDAMFKKHKDVIPVNVIRSISTMGGPPAINENGEIEDAVAFWYLKMHHVSAEMGITGIESWNNLNNRVCGVTSDICRRIMPAPIAFGYRPYTKHW